MRLIDADALIKWTQECGEKWPTVSVEKLFNKIKDAPTIDPVKHGEWIDEPVYKQTMDGKTWDGYTYCSECRGMYKYGYRSNYCSKCGAKMERSEYGGT